MELPTDIEQYVRGSFAASDIPNVLQVLERAVLHDGSAPNHRILRCLVVASDGSLSKLRTHVEVLIMDFRDVIVAGEYESRDGELVRVRDLSRPLDLDD